MTTPQAILQRVLPYVPPYWVRQAWMDPHQSLVGREACLRAAVLFVDISGFTPLTEALSQKGPEGIEELSSLLDRYFDAMSAPVIALGGEVFKFAGDSLIVLFDADQDELYLGAALECAIRMQQAVRTFIDMHTLAGSFSLQIKVGISEGPVYTTTVGDESGGMLPVLAGRALVRAMQAEKAALAGEIVADGMLTSRLPGRLDIGEARGTFRLIAGARDVPVPPHAPPPALSEWENDRAALLVQRLGPYLAAQVMERIEQGDRAVLCEHRCVTTMFVRFGGLTLDQMAPDCVGAEGLALSRDGRVLQDYVVAMRDCVRRYGGRLNEVDFTAQGGTLVVFFGAPTAQENNELQAVLCAWEMRQAHARLLADLRAQFGPDNAPGLRQCVSISSGTVFVGDVGARVRRTYAVVGDGVNLASRLAGLAQWDEIWVSQPVRRAAEGQFDFASLGEREIRGKIERVSVAQLIKRRQPSRTDSPLSRLLLHRMPVGRAPELEVLDDVRERAWQGRPQLVQIVGQAGMGKSCLAGQLADRWLVRGGRVFAADGRLEGNGGCQGAQGERLDLHGLWLAVMRGAFGLLSTDSREQQRQRTQRELAGLALDPESAALLQEFVLAGGDGLFVNRRVRQRLHQAVIDFLRVSSANQPLLLVLEDLDRVDDASLGLLRELLGDLQIVQDQHAPILVCATGRPLGRANLYDPDGSGRSIEERERALVFGTTRMILGPLSEAASQTLAEQLLQEAGVGSEGDLLPVLLRRGGGNPFFIQEMIRELADAQGDEVVLSNSFVPERVAHAVLAQLDPLGEDLKLTLRLAAVIGHSFSFHILQAAHLAPISAQELANRLSKLERMHIVRLTYVGVSSSERGSMEEGAGDWSRAVRASPNVYYGFRHPMTQQVVYASLLSVDRERFHRAVAYAIERVYGAVLDTQYERLAEHFSQGKVLDRAVSYSMLAGRSAVKARAVREALTYYDRADEMLRAMADECLDLCVQGVQLSLTLERARVLCHLMEIARAEADLERAVSCADKLADLGLQGRALLAWAEILIHKAEYGSAVALVRRAMHCFVALGDRTRQSRAWKLQSRIHVAMGQPEAALRCVQHASSTAYEQYLYMIYLGAAAVSTETKAGGYRRQPSTTDWSLTIEQPVWSALVAAYRGEWGRALRLAQDGIAAGWALGTPLDVADARWTLAFVLTRIGAFEEASSHLEEAMAAYQEAGWKRGQISGLVLRGQIGLGLGQHTSAAASFKEALGLGKETHTVQAIIQAQVGLGQLAATRRQWRRAERWCVEARARAHQAHLGAARVEAQIGLARVYLAQGQWNLARTQAAQALESSRRLGFQDVIVESADLLGQVWKGLGDMGRACECLREADVAAEQLVETLSPAHTELFRLRRGELGRI